MAGCGGNCQCSAPQSPESTQGRAACNGPCSRREAPRDRYTLTDALARVIVDNRIVRAALEVSKQYPEYTAEDIITMVNLMKEDGRLNDYA